MSEVGKIEMQPWYFGFLSRDHIVSHLSKPGDWCVRSSGTNEERVLYVITKIDDRNVRELKLVYKENEKGWTLIDVKNKETNDENSITYGSVHELLSAESPVSQKMRLRSPINRPRYLLDDENLKITDIELGRGHYAEVVKGTLKLDGQEITVAVKRCIQVDTAISISDQRPTKEIIKAKLAKSQMIAEARLVYNFVHDNIIRMYGIACKFAPVKIVMEYCPGGSLRDLLLEKKESIKNVERNIFLYEAAKALRHLQLRKCVHRWDVAARNCLIGISGSLKLSDFGLSRPVEDLKGLHSDDENIAWPIPWMAPETLSKKPKFTTKSDVYAFGILIYEVYTCGGMPWPDIRAAEDIIPIVRKGKIMPTPPLMSEKNLEKIMRDCWKRKAIDRPDFIEIVKRFRAILRSEKLPDKQERVISMLKGVDSSKNSIKLEEDSPDSVMSKQRELDEKGVQKLSETTEEGSVSTLPMGAERASVPALHIPIHKHDKRTVSAQPRGKKAALERLMQPSLLQRPSKYNVPEKRKRVAKSVSAVDTAAYRKSSGYFKKFTRPLSSMRSRQRARHARYKTRQKTTKSTPQAAPTSPAPHPADEDATGVTQAEDK